VVYGIRQVPKARVLSARTLGAKGVFLVTRVILPSAVPSTIGAFRIAISLGLVVVVVTEMFTGTEQGLGKRIYDSGLIYEMPTMYGAILLTGFLGYGLNRIIVLVEHSISKWFNV
jgi:NitT/TauT family transport system permease protein